MGMDAQVVGGDRRGEGLEVGFDGYLFLIRARCGRRGWRKQRH